MLHFTNHARDRMKERTISKQEVKICLENYQLSYPDDNDKMNLHIFPLAGALGSW